MARFVETPEFRDAKERITSQVETRVRVICSTENPLTLDGQSKILKAQGELAGMRLVFALFSQPEEEEQKDA